MNHRKLNSIKHDCIDGAMLVLIFCGVLAAFMTVAGLFWIIISVVFLVDPGNPYNTVAGGFLLKNTYVDQKDMLKQYPKPDGWKGSARQWIKSVIARIKQLRVYSRQSAFRIEQKVAEGRRDNLSRREIAQECIDSPLVTKGWKNKPSLDEMQHLVGTIIHNKYVKPNEPTNEEIITYGDKKLSTFDKDMKSLEGEGLLKIVEFPKNS